MDDREPSPKFGVINFDKAAHRRDEVARAAAELLRMAEAGEIFDLAYAVTEANGNVATMHTTTDNALVRLAAVSLLLAGLQRSLLEPIGCCHD